MGRLGEGLGNRYPLPKPLYRFLFGVKGPKMVILLVRLGGRQLIVHAIPGSRERSARRSAFRESGCSKLAYFDLRPPSVCRKLKSSSLCSRFLPEFRPFCAISPPSCSNRARKVPSQVPPRHLHRVQPRSRVPGMACTISCLPPRRSSKITIFGLKTLLMTKPPLEHVWGVVQ